VETQATGGQALEETEPMATTRRTSVPGGPGPTVDYPTSDGKPMAETDLHRQDVVDLIETLKDHFAADPNVYVSGNLPLYYVEGDPRRSVAPDVLVARDVPKLPPRKYYQVWKEGKAPDVVIEITSQTTRRQDQTKKKALYRDVLKVPECFQFDPTEDYLTPSLQGVRLVEGQYVPITAVEGRLPSAILGLHLERRGTELRLYDPATGRCLLTPTERAAEEAAARHHAEQERRREAEARHHAEQERLRVENENEQLRRELEALRRAQRGDA
jgi:Uma2 family endonuclease